MFDVNLRNQFWNRIQNVQFQKLFLKNWLKVFLCVIIPLTLSVNILGYFAEDSLIQEIDTASSRSTLNTASTINALINEITNSLDSLVVHPDVANFFQSSRQEPQTYDYISTVTTVQKLIDTSYRMDLYTSVDVYSSIGNYVVCSPQNAYASNRFSENSLLDTFFACRSQHLGQSRLASLRHVYHSSDSKYDTVLTFYLCRGLREDNLSFVSLSVDIEKLVQYISAQQNTNGFSYLLLDENHQILLDTSGQFTQDTIPLSEKYGEAINHVIDGTTMRFSWVPLNQFGWKCVQVVPLTEYEQTRAHFRRLESVIWLVSTLIAIALSYHTTSKLFTPIEAILNILENPSEQFRLGGQSGEIQYLLMSILNLFQKNITLERQMVERISALRQARAKALQEQMTPHFLNNVLQAIYWTSVAETGREDSITSKSLILLADIVGASKEHPSNMTTVTEEIDFTQKFVKLEQLRYGPDIHCHFQVDPSITSRLIPCISLQTLIENAISHGLSPKGGFGNVYIIIEPVTDQNLRIRVEDDGVGFQQKTIDEILEKLQSGYLYVGEHLGLVNLFQRFRLIYGDACCFSITRSEYGGACVEIIIPELPDQWMAGSH